MRVVNPPQFVAIETSLGPVTGDQLGATVNGVNRLSVTPSGTVTLYIIDIGIWNMDTTAQVDVSYPVGMNYKLIRGISIIIRNDINTLLYSVPTGVAGGASAVECSGMLSSGVRISRTNGGMFDSASYASVEINRGWITIIYDIT